MEHLQLREEESTRHNTKNTCLKPSMKFVKMKNKRLIKAYNTAAYRMNNGLIEKYKSEYDDKKRIKGNNYDYGNDEEYNKGMYSLFNEVATTEYNKLLYSDIVNNANYKKGKDIAEKYSLSTHDTFTQNVEDDFKELYKLVKE